MICGLFLRLRLSRVHHHRRRVWSRRDRVRSYVTHAAVRYSSGAVRGKICPSLELGFAAALLQLLARKLARGRSNLLVVYSFAGLVSLYNDAAMEENRYGCSRVKKLDCE